MADDRVSAHRHSIYELPYTVTQCCPVDILCLNVQLQWRELLDALCHCYLTLDSCPVNQTHSFIHLSSAELLRAGFYFFWDSGRNWKKPESELEWQ